MNDNAQQSALVMPRIWVNAECQRLLWLHFRAVLLLLPVLLTLVVWGYDHFSVHDKLTYALMLSVTGALTIIGLIGRSLRKDLGGYMFDQLRMSTLSPWQMTYARLLAAPLLGWLVFGFGLMLVAWHPYVRNYQHLLMQTPYWLTCALLLMWSLACLMLLSSLQIRHGNHRWNGGRMQSALLLLSVFLLLVSMMRGQYDELRMILPLFGEGRWLVVPNQVLVTLSIAWLAFLMGLAARAAMASALHLARMRWFWLGFALLLPSVFWLGFGSLRSFLFIASMTYACLAWLSLACEDHRLMQAWRTKRFGDVPLWAFLLPLALLGLWAVEPVLAKRFAGHFLGFGACWLVVLPIKAPYNRSGMALLLYVVAYIVFEKIS